MLVLYEYVPVPEMYAGLAALGLLGGLRLVRLTGLQTKYKSVISRSSVVDPDPYWIRIQEPYGSVFGIRIRIHTCKFRIKCRQDNR